MPGKSKFQSSWLSNDSYKDWVAPDTANPHRAKCKPCGKTFDVTAMGECALKSHMKSAKHSVMVQQAGASSVLHYLAPRASERGAGPSEESTGTVSSCAMDLDRTCKAHEMVTDAEILWTLKVVTCHYSYRSSSQASDLFKRMFPDSEVAKSFSCGEKKCAYVTCYGLRPFFQSSLQREIENSDYYVVLFDESGNEFLQQKQMDVHVRCWNSSHKVETRYLTSVFMGHATAENIQEKLLKALEPLPLQKIVQVSMDGPNVNLKLFRSLQADLLENHQVQCVDLGTCGLHTVHNAYKAGVVASKWELDVLLSSMGILFDSSPARREDFQTVTGQSTFPLKFVSHRWLENVSVIERTLLLWSDLKKYIESARNKHVTLPRCASFENLCTFSRDPLVVAKLNFALAVAMVLRPFLTEYQTDKPMVFFLARDLEMVVRKLLIKFIKCSVLSTAGISGLLRLNVEDVNNHVPLEKVDIGHACEQIIRDSKASAKDVFQFKMESKKFLMAVAKKVLEKSPLKFPLVRGLSSLDPRVMCNKPDECIAGLRRVVDTLVTARRVTNNQRDSALAEYTELLQEQGHLLRLFEKGLNRLDEFFYELMGLSSSYVELWNVVKLLLVLSHGQATVERGFSVNRQIAVENLKELSYISQRIICDAVEKAGGVLSIPITKDLRKSVSAARNRYNAHMEAQKKEKLEEFRQSKRRLVEDELDSMRQKKKKLEAVIADLTASADRYAERAEASNDITFIVKSNSLRKTAKSKVGELADITQLIQEKTQQLH